MHLVLLLAIASPTPHASPSMPATLEYVDLELRFANDQMMVLRMTLGHFSTPTNLPRGMGRFAARMRKMGAQLPELRFDFPQLSRASSSTDKNISVTTTVRVPVYEGVERIVLFDGERRLVSVNPAAVRDAPPALGLQRTDRASPDAGTAKP